MTCEYRLISSCFGRFLLLVLQWYWWDFWLSGIAELRSHVFTSSSENINFGFCLIVSVLERLSTIQVIFSTCWIIGYLFFYSLGPREKFNQRGSCVTEPPSKSTTSEASSFLQKYSSQPRVEKRVCIINLSVSHLSGICVWWYCVSTTVPCGNWVTATRSDNHRQ